MIQNYNVLETTSKNMKMQREANNIKIRQNAVSSIII